MRVFHVVIISTMWAMCIHYVDSCDPVTINCDESNGTKQGRVCRFEPDEELEIGAVIAYLNVNLGDCNVEDLEIVEWVTNNEISFAELNGLNLTITKVVDYDKDVDTVNTNSFELFCPTCKPGDSNLAIEFKNLDDNKLYLNYSYTEAEVTELLTYTGSISDEPRMEPSPGIGSLASDQDRGTKIRYKILDEGVPFLLADSTDSPDIDGVCFDSTFYVKPDVKINTPELYLVTDGNYVFNHRRQSVYNMTIGIYSFHDTNGCNLDVTAANDNATVPLVVTVIDLDDQPPTFKDTIYQANVDENSDDITVSPEIEAYDLDTGIDTPILYSIQERGNWSCTSYVTIDSSTGVLSIRDGQQFDYEDHSVCELDLKAEQENNDLKTAYAPLTITVKDVNDNCPEIEASSSEGLFVDGDDFVSDEDLRGWLYLHIADKDTEVNYFMEISSQYFELEDCLNDDNCYWIKPDNTPAETETVVVTVMDTLFDGFYCNSSLAINISVPHESTILDPTFDSSDYQETIEENYAGFVIQVTATSSDGTKDGIRYSLEQNSIYFSIDEVSGNISLLQDLDYETMRHSYELTVKATDIRWTDAERSAEAIVTVTLSNLNDNVPVLEGFPLTLYVAESTPNGTIVAYVQASDADEDAILTVKFDTIPPEFPFEMDHLGAISVNGILDADVEAQREYNATVVVNDREMSSSPENLTVVVLDVNDNAPSVSAESNFQLEMTENTIGSISFQIEVTDSDYLPENRDCSVTSSGGNNVTLENAVIEVVGPFDREAQEEFQFLLFVTNTAPPNFQITQPVVVTILDVNDNSPVFTQETEVDCSSLVISEGPVELSDNPLCTFEATDADEPGSANAKITYLVEENEYFEMNNETGQLLLVNPLDRESQENMTIRVSAEDNGNESLSVSMTVLIEVTGINDNRPTFNSATYEELVHEETAINTLISTLTAVDSDVPSQDPIYYKAVNEQDPIWNTFYLKSEDGLCKIYLLQALDYSQSPYELEIATYDGDKNPYYDSTIGDNTTTLVVKVQQRETCDISVADGITETIDDVDLVDDGVVADVDASSSCDGEEDDIMYTLDEEVYVDGTGGEMVTNYFSIDSTTGEIYAEDVTNIDVGTYRLTVTAANDTGSDLDQTSDTTEVVIIVSDTNNNCPYFEKISYSSQYMMGDEFLSQDGAPDWLVITAIDDDLTFIGDIEFPMNASFEEYPVTDTIERRTFQVRVVSELSQNTNLTVTVTDGNCNDITDIFVMVVTSFAPTFENDTYVTSVLENSEAGKSVIKVSAINSAGTSQNISYNIVSPPNSPFGIDAVTGEIFVAFEGIDYETQASYLLEVSATDERWTVESDRTSYAEVAVTVLDQNEFPPFFLGLPADVSIQESIPSGSEVYILRAFDNDVDDNDGNLKYELVDGGDGKFIVDPDSGKVLTNYSFDFETDAVLSYQLEVQVTDGVYETVDDLTVSVMDVNDNPPVFNDDSPKGNFPENEDGPFFINASASDVDSLMLSYSLSGGYPLNTTINDDGILTIGGNLDREEQETYTFSVVARDGTFRSAVEVTVTVEDKNDNTPEFTDLCDGEVSVFENSPVGTQVCQVSAVDKDKENTPFSQISYSLANNGEGYFQINSSTGEITVKKEGLNFEEIVKTYTLQVEATDINGSGRSSDSTIRIELEDLNDNPPLFVEHPDPIDIIFDHEIGDTVFTFLVTDLDEQPFNSFLCKELDASDAAWDTFYLTTMIDGCNLVLKANLNSSLSYRVRIEAYDINNVTLRDSTEADVVVLQRYPCELILSVDDVEYYKTEVVQGQIVADVEATSNCSDSEEDVTFDITSQEYSDPFNVTRNSSREFAIHSNNGTVYYDQTEGTPSVGVHKLVIRARNNTNPSNKKSTELMVTILDVDIEDPTFPEPPVDIPDNPDPDSLPVFIGRFDGDTDDYVYTFTGTDRLVIVVLDDDACFNGDVSIVDPSIPFSLEPLTDDDKCNNNYQAYLKIENTVPPEEDLFTFQMEVTSGNYSEYANITVVQLSLDPSIESIQGDNVDENALVGTSVVNVTAVNCDGTSDGIMYEITEQDVPYYFGISGGAVTVNSLGIDYESQTSYSLKISVIDTRWDSPRETSSAIDISVNDINEFAPEFASFTKVQLTESLATEDALVYRLQAFDGDGSSMLTFQLGNLSDTFELDNVTGDLTLIRGLNAEVDALSYFVHVIVSDGENIDEDVLTVQLVDVNEFPPNITGQSQVEMYENETETTLQIYSYDPDVSQLDIEYTMMPQDGVGSIDPSTGLITFVGPLDYTKTPYDYVVTATEIDGLFSSTFEVTLMVLNINDEPLVLDVSPCEGAEAQEGPDGIGPVCQVQVKDEEGSNFIFYLQDSTGKFDIDQSTGELSVKNMLDREIQDTYELQLVVNDGGSPSRNSTVESVAVSVTDINDEPPEFAVHANPVYLEAGSDPATTVIGLTISDEDEFPYDISRCEEKDPEESLWQNFTILNVVSGFCEIITLAPLYVPSIYTLNIVVVDSDNEALQSETSVTVLVVGDITCLLSLSVDSPLMFDEDQIDPGDTVTTVSSNSTCSDSDDIAYEITEQILEDSQGFTKDVDVFQIDEQTGEISVNSSIVEVPVGVYTLTVTAYNTSYVISRATSELVIIINDINNNCPFFVMDYEQGLYAENDKFVYSLDSPNRLLIMAEDLDSDFTGDFSTNSADFDPIDSTFSPNLVAVQLSVNEGATGNYTIQVDVTDDFLSNCSDHITVDIFQVQQEDLAPTFSQESFNGTVLENVEKGTFILTVTAEAFDGNSDEIVYSFSVSDDRLEIDETSGEITAGPRGIDFETTPRFEKLVFAEDRRWNPYRRSQVRVFITVEDEDEYDLELAAIPPLSISENAPENTVIYTAWATDGDASSEFLFSLEGGNGTFDIRPDSGEIYVFGELDAEVVSEYEVIIIVTEESMSVSDSQTVTIGIQDMNDCGPEFNQTVYEIEIEEEMQGVHMLQVYATDKDVTESNNVVTYSIDDDLNGRCSIDPTEGILTIDTETEVFDRETVSEYTIVVTAEDSGIPTLSSMAVINVTILDVNDNSPEFVVVVDPVVFEEESVTNSAVFRAEDLDDGINGEISYTVLSGDGKTTNLFSIDENGLLTASVPLDRDVTPSYNLIIYATDSGSPRRNDSVNVEVLLEDIDDSIPVFQPPFQVVIEASTPPGSKVIDVTATDEDVFPNNIISFSPANLEDEGWNTFALQSVEDQTSIVLVAPLEDAAMTVVLEVQARNPPDSDDRRNTANQEYIIVVTDGTLCYVELEPTSYSVHETTNLKKGEYIVKINGTSNCEDISFEYQISSQILTFFNGSDATVTEEWFVVSSTDGTLSVNSNDLHPGTYQIAVVAVNASDDAEKLNFVDSLVSIKITEGDNAPPSFINGGETITIERPIEEGGEVFRLYAADPDSVNSGNDLLSFQELYEESDGGLTDYFTVDADGRVTAAVNLWEVPETIVNLTVMVEDSGLPPLADFTFLLMELNRPSYVDPPPTISHDCDPIEYVPEGSTATICTVKSSDEAVTILVSPEDSFVVAEDGAISPSATDSLNFEHQQVYNVVVNVTSLTTMLSSSLLFVVMVTDVNEFPPRFENPYGFTISEDSYAADMMADCGSPYEFGVVMATDEDGSYNNSYIEYSLDGDERFSVDPVSGVLSKNDCIDVDGTPSDRSITLTVTASNVNADSKLYSNQSILVNVTDANDNPPSIIIVGAEKVIWNEYISNQEIFKFDYEDGDIDSVNQDSYYTHECSDERCESFMEFSTTGTTHTITTNENQPESSIEVVVIVTVKNVQGPNLEASETVTFVYTNENVYFPDDIEFQNVTIEEGSTTGSIIAPVGSTTDTPYSVRDEEGACSQVFEARQVSETRLNIIAKQELDYENVTEYQITIEVGDSCPVTAGTRVRRQTVDQVNSAVTTVTITVGNRDDIRPEFTKFTFSDSRNYYRGLHFTSIADEMVYDLSFASGRVIDEDGRPEDHKYSSADDSELVVVNEIGEVFLREYLSPADVTPDTVNLSVSVSDAAGSDQATLRLRVLSDADIAVVEFDPFTDPQGEQLLRCAQKAVKNNGTVLQEREVRSEDFSALWLYGVSSNPEEFMDLEIFQGFKANISACKNVTAEENPRNDTTGILVIILALLILIASILMILYLLCSANSYKQIREVATPPETESQQSSATPSESLKSYSPEIPVKTLSTFERIASQKNTNMYGSQTAILDLESEGDALSVKSLPISLPPPGTDEKDDVDPYSVFLHNPKSKTSKEDTGKDLPLGIDNPAYTPAGSKKSQDELPNENPEEHSNEDTLKDLLAEYDNPTFQEDGPASPVKLLGDHTKEETSTDDILAEGERTENTTGGSSGIKEGSEVGSNGVKSTTFEEKTPKKSEKDPTINKEDGDEINMSGGMTGAQSFEKDPKVTSL